MKTRLLLAALLALLLTSCTPVKYHRRYVILNSTGCTITNLTISDGNAAANNWEETLPDQAWIHSSRFRPQPVVVTWTDETGDHEISFSETKTARRLKAEFFIELSPSGTFAARVVEPPPDENSSAAAVLLVGLVYLGYCLAIVLLIVPVALAAVLAYLLFKAIQSALGAAYRGIRGDHTVFQFSIREIVLITTIVALACGWFVASN